MPFRWLWQCVILAKSDEGGAQASWISIVSGEPHMLQLTCTKYDDKFPTDIKITLKHRLQTADEIFTLSEDVAFQDSQLAHDIDDTVALALSQLKLPMLADTHTLSYEDRSGCLPNAIFRSNGCWQKTGENAEEFSQDDTNIVQRWSGVAKYNLYQQMRRLIACATDSACTDAQTPFESLHGTSLQILKTTVT